MSEHPPQDTKTALPVPMILHCPECGTRHIDTGEFEKKPHHTHACQVCGFSWRPAIGCTIGVRFLPGFKNTIATPLADRLRGLTVTVTCLDDHMNLIKSVGDLEAELESERQLLSWKRSSEVEAIKAAIYGRGSPVVDNQWFKDQVVPIDGWVFRKCQFEKCVLVYDGGLWSFQECVVLNCTVRYTGASKADPKEKTNPGG